MDSDWSKKKWTKKLAGGIEFTFGGPPPKIYGTVCQAHKDAIDIGLINNDHCLNCEVDKLTRDNEAMEQALIAARHLLLAATGPEDGPTSWIETRDDLLKLIDEKILKGKA